MNKIYICTRDTMEMDLLTEGLDENQVEEKVNNIIEELSEALHVFTVGDYCIMGANTSLYLKLEYNITTMEREID